MAEALVGISRRKEQSIVKRGACRAANVLREEAMGIFCIVERPMYLSAKYLRTRRELTSDTNIVLHFAIGPPFPSQFGR